MDENAVTPKKYIRTFAGDVEAVKKGWTPNLSPLKNPSPASPLPSLKAMEGTTPAPPPVVPIKVQPPAEPIKTYESDFSQRMKDTHASAATVLAAEQDALPVIRQDVPEKTPRSTVLYSIAGALLLILGGVGAYFAYTTYLAKIQPIILAPSVSAPIFVDEREKITATTPKTILQAIGQSATRSLAPNEVRFLYTDSATGSTSSPQAPTDNSIFAALQLPAPGALLRNMNATGSMAGIVSAGGSQNTFFILSVSSYSQTFAGMLMWEPKMTRDLVALFPPYPQMVAATTVSTSSPQATAATSTPKAGTKVAAPPPAPVFMPSFTDEVVSNHDVRVYRDTAGESVLLYGYWNQTTLVIARDPAAFTELIGRLATVRTQ
ncbi:MAG: hypothetical protein Q7R59_00580 [bacterium]|nr:hypothetical protein [bacterium]